MPRADAKDPFRLYSVCKAGKGPFSQSIAGSFSSLCPDGPALGHVPSLSRVQTVLLAGMCVSFSDGGGAAVPCRHVPLPMSPTLWRVAVGRVEFHLR